MVLHNIEKMKKMKTYQQTHIYVYSEYKKCEQCINQLTKNIKLLKSSPILSSIPSNYTWTNIC